MQITKFDNMFVNILAVTQSGCSYKRKTYHQKKKKLSNLDDNKKCLLIKEFFDCINFILENYVISIIVTSQLLLLLLCDTLVVNCNL